jgi:hypothetical protein
MPPQLPNQNQNVIMTNEILRAARDSRQRAAQANVPSSGGGLASAIGRIVGFLVMLAILAVLLKVGLSIVHTHHGF